MRYLIKNGYGKYSGIYQIKNLVNGKIYIGSAVSFNQRYHKHIEHHRSGKNPCRLLDKAFCKYGIENFAFSILEICDRDKVLEREQWFLDNTITHYNIRKFADNNLGISHAKDAMSRRKGGEHPNGRAVIQYSLDGKKIKVWGGVSEAARALGIYNANIAKVCNGERYSTGGYRWAMVGKKLINKQFHNTGKSVPVVLEKFGLQFRFPTQEAAANFLRKAGFTLCKQGDISEGINKGRLVYGYKVYRDKTISLSQIEAVLKKRFRKTQENGK